MQPQTSYKSLKPDKGTLAKALMQRYEVFYWSNCSFDAEQGIIALIIVRVLLLYLGEATETQPSRSRALANA